MNAQIEIAELSPEEWRAYKELRLRALKEEHEAFGSSYEEGLQTTDEEWRKKLLESQEGKRMWYLFAKENNHLVGMIGAHTERGKKVEHLANIVGVYVVSESRGKGLEENY